MRMLCLIIATVLYGVSPVSSDTHRPPQELPDFSKLVTQRAPSTPSPDGIWSQLPPIGRAFHTAVYDVGAERMIVFGGEGASELNDLWTLSLNGPSFWAEVKLSAPPPARLLHSAIYDVFNSRMVIFGGVGDSYFNDVWALSLGPAPAWSELTSSGGPPSPRLGAASAYDSSRKRMLVFGGNDGELRNDVWSLSLDGSVAWSQVAVNGAPPARFLNTAVYDVAHDRMVVFGGTNGSFLDDVWALNLSGTPSWEQLFPVGPGPSARAGATAIYAIESDVMVLSGGTDGNNLNDAWILTLWDPRWIQVAGATPPPRSFHTAIYQHSTERMLIFGGQNEPAQPHRDDIWSLSLVSNSWSPVVVDQAPARSSHSAIYDLGRDRIVIFGGQDNMGSPFRNDTWLLSLSDVVAFEEMVTPANPPAARVEHSAIYDPLGDRMIVFGGRSASHVHDDIFLLSFSSGEWYQADPGTSPPWRYSHGAIYDPLRHQMVVFGGDSGVDLLDDVWALSLSNPLAWTQMSPIGIGPSARRDHGMVYDPLRDRILIFGGDDGVFVNDTWALSLPGLQWTELLPNGPSPSPRATPLVYDSSQDRLVLFAGNGSAVHEDVWALALAGSLAWNELQPTGLLPSARYGHTMFYDAIRDRAIAFGGTDSNLVFDNAWALTWDALPSGVGPLQAGDSAVLHPCYPNPFNPAVTIPFELATGGNVAISVHDVAGRIVRTVLSSWKTAGIHTVSWDGRNDAGTKVSSGVYFCRLESGNELATRKLVLLK